MQLDAEQRATVPAAVAAWCDEMDSRGKRFTEVERPQRLAYMSLVDFVPDMPPYEFPTVVELQPANGGVQVTMTVGAMHDQVWTERLLAGRANELDNLATLIQSRR